MSKKILIIIGALTIILMIGAWVYLFVFGTPKNIDQALNNLNSPSTPYEQPIASNPTSTVAVTSKDLAQLSTRYVAGFSIIDSGIPVVRYTEKGTGHIFEVDLNSGTEERIDGTTIANASEAYFRPDGEQVVIVSTNNNERKVIWRTLIGQTGGEDLPGNSFDFTWDEDGNLFYTVKTPGLTVAYKNSDGSNTELWRVPLSDIRVFFTKGGDFIINSPASRLAGGLYQVNEGNLKPIINNQYAFTATTDREGQLFMYRYFDTKDKATMAKAFDIFTEEELQASLSSVPEKCALDSVNSRVWCASSFSFLGTDREYLNKWYKGEVTSPDKLWVSNYNDLGSATLAIDLSDQAGFYIDVTDLTVGAGGKILLFKNKINDALWMYRINETNTEAEAENETPTTTSDAF